MKNILKIEAFSGASGDMFLGALAGLADAYEELFDLPSILNLKNETEVLITDVKKNGISCKHVKIIDLVNEHHHRHLSHIIEIIKKSSLTENAKKIAIDIFNIIGKAEAEVHNIPIEKIHFHEVGAIDSIMDICGTAYLLDKLNITESYICSLTTGKGFVNTAHGLLPVPCPATKLIIEGFSYDFGNEEGEKLTPTGAAIINYLQPKRNCSDLIDIKTSYGAGEKNFNAPNVLRVSLCKKENISNELIVVEANIDDGNNEHLGVEFQNRLFEFGAIEFYYSQILMKKGRPGILLTVICKQENFNSITDFVLNFSTTIGLKYFTVNRIELKREIVNVETEYGIFRVKISYTPNGEKKIKPESEDVLNYAIKNNLNPKTLSQKILGAYEKGN
ncbi:MAG: nickel pincer cofactor biosynthesis protein LarC [Ignavibacteriales bacterium]|nr:nickel pincer cofactor biosynthesis protein LarC [Ignavibacteriales bacterium]